MSRRFPFPRLVLLSGCAVGPLLKFANADADAIEKLLSQGVSPGEISIRMSTTSSGGGGDQQAQGTNSKTQGTNGKKTREITNLEQIAKLLPTNLGGGTIQVIPIGGGGGGGGDIVANMMRELDVAMAMGVMPMIQKLTPHRHPCDTVLEKVCPGVPRARTHDSIHCLLAHEQQNTPECENTIKISLPYLCHDELNTICSEDKADAFDVSPLQCLRNALEKTQTTTGGASDNGAAGGSGQPKPLVSEQCKEAMVLTHKVIGDLNAGNKVSVHGPDGTELMVLDPHTGHSLQSLDAAQQHHHTCMFPLLFLFLMSLAIGGLMNRSPTFRNRVEYAFRRMAAAQQGKENDLAGAYSGANTLDHVVVPGGGSFGGAGAGGNLSARGGLNEALKTKHKNLAAAVDLENGCVSMTVKKTSSGTSDEANRNPLEHYRNDMDTVVL
eukprot:CAMPEP_0179004546 /NCGR_PEP_ID=MMETSP0795-20121207/13369_1 /TAXON_ID=88552 /ORGANISM="Amoebophrya sp., Strain Ameob2" /LENGTH=438 /DNA_ID=CAMNT_0020698829 /DNA_START=79 /DNA_END=1395 /DNA_ORIENTATION=-